MPVKGIKKKTQISKALKSLMPIDVLMMFTMAFVTQPRIRQFINRPRYTARKPRRKAVANLEAFTKCDSLPSFLRKRR